MSDNMLITLPAKTKPSKGCGTDKSRPHLHSAYLEERDGEPILTATDSYKLLWLPVQVEGKVKPTNIPADALKAVEKTGRGEIGEYVEPLDKQGNANGVLFRKPDHERPKWADLDWPKKPAKKDRLVVGINAKLLFELAQGLAAYNGPHLGGLKLTFDLSKAKDFADGKTLEAPTLVEPLRADGSRGLLMPIRVNL